MNRGLIIGSIALLIIVLIGAAVFFTRGNNQQQNVNTNTQNEQISQTPRSFKELMNLADNKMCAFSDEEHNHGTIYVGNGKVRGDFTSVNGDVTNISHMINDGNSIYVWFDGAEEGFKGDLSMLEKVNSQNDNTSTKTIDPDKKVDYKCEDWNVDQSVFALPNINFQDYSQMMNAMPSGMMDQSGNNSASDVKETQCKACESLPDDAAAQCRQALSC